MSEADASTPREATLNEALDVMAQLMATNFETQRDQAVRLTLCLNDSLEKLARPVSPGPPPAEPSVMGAGCGMPPMPTLRELRDAAASIYGNPEDCDECGALSETGDDRPCAVHGSARFYKALRAADEILGPCVCGHHSSEHEDVDSTHCHKCGCKGFQLPPTAASTEPAEGYYETIPWSADEIHRLRLRVGDNEMTGNDNGTVQAMLECLARQKDKATAASTEPRQRDDWDEAQDEARILGGPFPSRPAEPPAPAPRQNWTPCQCPCGCGDNTIAPGRCMMCRVRESCLKLPAPVQSGDLRERLKKRANELADVGDEARASVYFRDAVLMREAAAALAASPPVPWTREQVEDMAEGLESQGLRYLYAAESMTDLIGIVRAYAASLPAAPGQGRTPDAPGKE